MERTEISQNDRKVTISVCMIVKDELENLKRGLPTFIPWADEIIVNDTGSTDGTLEFLKTQPVKIIQSTWENNFSYSRNVAIGGASKDWVIAMDADEYMTENSIKAMFVLKSKMAELEPTYCLGFTVQNLDKGRAIGQSYMNFRMFPNFRGIRYNGKIHEQFVKSADALGFKYITTDVVVHHTGYDGQDKLLAKARRDLDLMETDESLLDTPYGYIELGDAHSVLGELAVARDRYLDAYNSPLSGKYIEAKYAGAQNAGRMSYLMNDYTNAANLFALANKLKPELHEPLFYLAMIAVNTKQFTNAKTLLDAILTMPPVSTLVGTSYEKIMEMSKAMLVDVNKKLGEGLPTYARLKAGLDTLARSMQSAGMR